jgi:signal transduction histidine kinase
LDSTKEIVSLFWIGTITMISLGFCLLFLVMFYQNFFSKMKRKEAENLLRIALESEQKERSRIASDLHDSVSSDLTGIRNYLVLLSKKEEDVEKRALYKDLQTGVEVAIENTRMVSYMIMPPMLEEYGFVVAITDYFEQLSKNSGFVFEVHCKNENFEIDAAKRYELFRIVQEFCTNMLKYGQIKCCVLTLYSLDSKIFLELIDDGIVFDFITALKTSKGAGLKSITSRIQFIGATIEQREVVQGNHFVLTL